MEHILSHNKIDFTLSHDDFNSTVGQKALDILKERHKKQVGGIFHINGKGKIFIIGDLHEQVDILLDIFEHIQSNQKQILTKTKTIKLYYLET